MLENKRNVIESDALREAGIALIAMYSNIYSERRIAGHNHGDCFEICYLKRGSQSYYIGKKEYVINGGEIFITFPLEDHSTGTLPQGRGCLYWFQVDSSCDSLLGLSETETELLLDRLSSVKHRQMKIHTDTAAKLLNAYKLIEKGGEAELIAAKALLTLFLLEITETKTENAEQNVITEPTRRAIQYIDEHIKDRISVPELAELINFSLSHFKFKFRRETGLPPGEYIMQRKIYDSIPMLKENTLTFIAYEYGFSSSQHYSKSFKAVTGKTPREYKRSMSVEQEAK